MLMCSVYPEGFIAKAVHGLGKEMQSFAVFSTMQPPSIILPMRQLPKSKPTAGPRHATQQRSVRKKLTPMTPVLRFAPVTPVRRLNLPARPRLNR